MEVVAAMNAVFSCFDELLDTFDVYKVMIYTIDEKIFVCVYILFYSYVVDYENFV